MNPRLIRIFLIISTIAFTTTLLFLFFAQQGSSVTYTEGVSIFNGPPIQISQSSQDKEQTIQKATFLLKGSNSHNQNPSQNGNTPSRPSKTPEQTLHEYERKLDSTYLWGTYKPHLIHAVTQRSPKPLTFGMIYMATEANSKLFHSYQDIRNQPKLYSEYLYHDGKAISESIFKDKQSSFELHNHFYKERSQEERQRWHSVTRKEKSGAGFLNNKASLIYYFTIENFDGLNDQRYLEVNASGVITVKNGANGQSVGYYKMIVYDLNDNVVPFADVQKMIYVDTQTPKKDTWRVKDHLRLQFNVDPTVKFRVLPDNYKQQSGNKNVNLIAIQLILDSYASFYVHVVYDQVGGFENVEDNVFRVKGMTKYPTSVFEPEYSKVFAKDVNAREKTCGLSALSNLLSGIGYYYGNIRIKGQEYSQQPKLPLYTATPSKTEFPRGFLWDEGFHGLVYCKWNMEICIDILRHWMNTQLESGWIPREQLRGAECENNGNANFIAQIQNEANPPTLMFLVMALHDYQSKGLLPNGAGEMLNTIYPSLKKWFNWFYSTQAANEQGLLAWKSDALDRGLVLGSGLDDYPRGLERGMKPKAHLDLQIWVLYMAETMSKLADSFGEKEDLKSFQELGKLLKSNLYQFLDKDNVYKDLVMDGSGKKTFSPHFGYVNLFPLFFGHVEKDSPVLDTLLDYIKDTTKMWSSYGLLSLSRSDSLYMRTTDAYWGGPIWININYLVLRGLKLYYYENEKARAVYDELRGNIIRTVCQNKEMRGYFFEQYNQDNGNGQKNHPFTGWTTTVLLMIYEKY